MNNKRRSKKKSVFVLFVECSKDRKKKKSKRKIYKEPLMRFKRANDKKKKN